MCYGNEELHVLWKKIDFCEHLEYNINGCGCGGTVDALSSDGSVYDV